MEKTGLEAVPQTLSTSEGRTVRWPAFTPLILSYLGTEGVEGWSFSLLVSKSVRDGLAAPGLRC